MWGRWRQIRWLALATLLALVFVALPLAPSEAHTLAGGIPSLHHYNETAKTAPLVSPLPLQLPCDGHHCAHGPFCCMSGCLGSGLAVAPEVPLFAPSREFARFLLPPPERGHGFGVRPALPPPRAFV